MRALLPLLCIFVSLAFPSVSLAERGVSHVTVTPGVANGQPYYRVTAYLEKSGTYGLGNVTITVTQPDYTTATQSFYMGDYQGVYPGLTQSIPATKVWDFYPTKGGDHKVTARFVGAWMTSAQQGGGNVYYYPVSFTGQNCPIVEFHWVDPVPKPPTAPEPNGYLAGTNTVSAKWKAAFDYDGVAGYEISQNGVVVASPRGPTATIGGLAPNTAYVFKARAQDVTGLWGDWSAPVNATTGSYPASDVDGDGLPNTWETANGLNPNSWSAYYLHAPSGMTYSEYYFFSLNPGSYQAGETRRKVRLNSISTAKGTGTLNGSTFNGSASEWKAPTWSPTGAAFDDYEGVEKEYTVSQSGLADYRIRYFPDEKHTPRWLMSEVYINGAAMDAVTKQDVDLGSGKYKVRVELATRVPFAQIDLSGVEHEQVINLGMGVDRLGKSGGIFSVKNGPFAYDDQSLSEMATKFAFVSGPGTLGLIQDDEKVRAWSASGCMDASLEPNRIVAKFYPAGAVAVGAGGAIAAAPIATYRFDFASFNEPLPTGDYAMSQRLRKAIRVERTIGGIAEAMTLDSVWSQSRSNSWVPMLPDGSNARKEEKNYQTVATLWPWRAVASPKANPTLLSYTAYSLIFYTSSGSEYINVTPSCSLNRADYAGLEGQLTGMVSDSRKTFPQNDLAMRQTPDGISLGTGSDFFAQYGESKSKPDGTYLGTGHFPGRVRWSATGASTYTERFRGYEYPIADNLEGQPAIAIGSTKLMRQTFLDGSLSDSNVIVTTYTYKPELVDGQVVPIEILSKQGAADIARSSFAYEVFTPTFTTRKAVKVTESKYASASLSESSIAISYSVAIDDADIRGKPISETAPSGAKTSYAYQRGTLSGSTWTPGAGGSHILAAAVSGKAGVGVAAFKPTPSISIAMDALDLETNRSAASETIVNERGQLLRDAKYVYTGSGNFAMLSATYNTYDQFGNLLRANRDAPTGAILYEASYTGLRKNWEADAQGVKTIYAYDAFGRVATSTKEGYAGQANIVTTYLYNGMRAEGHTIGSGANSLTWEYQFDTAGRPVYSSEPGIAATDIYYESATQIRTRYPNAAQCVTTIFNDGRPKSTTGEAVRDETHSYAYVAGQLQATKTLSTGAFSRVTHDWLGRAIVSSSPAFSGGTSDVVNTYDNKGQLIRTDYLSGAAKIKPSSLIQYDLYGRAEYTATDSNNNGSIDLSVDADVSRSYTDFRLHAGAWHLYEEKRAYPYAASSQSRLMGQSFAQLSGLAVGTASHTFADDAFGNLSDATVAVNRATRTLTTTTTVPGSAIAALETNVNGLVTSTRNAQGHVFAAQYDAIGRAAGAIDPRLGSTKPSLIFYKANSKLVDYTQSTEGIKTYFHYDAAGQVIRQRTLDNAGSTSKNARFKYDAMGNKTHAWGDGAVPAKYEYNELGQRVKMWTYRSGSWTDGDALPSGFSGAGDLTAWTYHAPSSLIQSKTDAAGAVMYAFAYDAAGRVVSKTDARGVDETNLYFDSTYASSGQFTGALRQTSYDVSGTPAVATPALVYAYRRDGLLASAADSAGTRSFSYYDSSTGADASLARSGLPLRETLPALYNGKVIDYDYHFGSAGQANGHRKAIAFDGSGTYRVQADYLKEGRLSSVYPQHQGTPATSFLYDYLPNSNLVDRVSRDTLSSQYNRDYAYSASGNQATEVKTLFGIWNPVSGQYASPINVNTATATHDSFVRSATRALTGDVAYGLSGYGSYGSHDAYGYDLKDQLTSAAKKQLTSAGAGGSALPGGSESHAYDPIGNRTQTGYQSNALNQYTRSVAAGSATLTYDANGNLTYDGVRDYKYDGRNNLSEAIPRAPAAGDAKILCKYDYLDRRAQKLVWTWSGSAWTPRSDLSSRYVHDGWNLIAELDDAYYAKKRYVWGNDISGSPQGAGGVGGLLSLQVGAVTLYPVYDAAHNVRGLLDTAGATAARYDYDAYGDLYASGGAHAAANPFRYSTKYSDDETGLVYYGRRYYAPELGRFLNRDPIEEDGGLNLYGFCLNDPVNRHDFLGMDPSRNDTIESRRQAEDAARTEAALNDKTKAPENAAKADADKARRDGERAGAQAQRREAIREYGIAGATFHNGAGNKNVMQAKTQAYQRAHNGSLLGSAIDRARSKADGEYQMKGAGEEGSEARSSDFKTPSSGTPAGPLLPNGQLSGPSLTVASGGFKGNVLDATFNVMNVKADGLQVVQVFYGTPSPSGRVFGNIVTLSGGKYDAFVDGGKNSPYVTLSGNQPAAAGKPYYLASSEVASQVSWNGNSGTLRVYDRPNAMVNFDQSRFETAIVAINYNGTGQDLVLGAFTWGWDDFGKTLVHSGVNLTGGLSGDAKTIVSHDYPGY